MLNEACKERLLNFKFQQAVKHLDDNATDEERDLIESLASVFGNSGWFDGHMQVIVWAAIRPLGVLYDDVGSG